MREMKGKVNLLVILIMMFLLSGCGSVHLKGTIPNYREEIYTVTDDINYIELQDEDVPVQIVPSNNGKLHFSYYCADDGSETYKVAESDGKITITKMSEPNYGIFIFGDEYSSDSYKNVKLTAYIPDDYEGDLSIRTLDGDVSVEDVAVDNLSVQAKDGDVSIEEVTVDKLSAYTKDGDVTSYNTNIRKELCCKTKEGDVSISYGDSL